jgi:hypothetical protein
MRRHVVRVFSTEDGKRRVEIYRRDDGHFAFEESYYSDDPEEQCWLPVSRQMVTLCDSEATAVREARGRISWLASRGA